MDDWKLKARSVVKLERTPNMFVSFSLSCLGNCCMHWKIVEGVC